MASGISCSQMHHIMTAMRPDSHKSGRAGACLTAFSDCTLSQQKMLHLPSDAQLKSGHFIFEHPVLNLLLVGQRLPSERKV